MSRQKKRKGTSPEQKRDNAHRWTAGGRCAICYERRHLENPLNCIGHPAPIVIDFRCFGNDTARP